MKHTTAHPICEDTATRQLKSIPEHWHIRRLKFVANIVAGQSPPSEIVTDYDGSFPFLQGNAEFGTTTPAPRFSCQTPNKRAQRGDILLSVRAPVGAINKADQDYGIGRGLCAISPTTHINEKFLHYTLQVTKISLSKVATGSTYDAVTVGQVGDIPTPLPPPSEQAAIVSYLDHAHELIARYISAKQRLIALLEEQRQAETRIAIADARTRWTRLETVAHAVARPINRVQTHEYTPIGLLNRGRGVFVKDSLKGSELGDSDFFWIEENDLIISGQFAWEGAVALAKPEHTGCVASHRYPILRGKPGTMETEFLLAFLRTDHGQMLLDVNSRGAAGRNRPLNSRTLLKETIPAPPIETQTRISALVHAEQQILAQTKKLREHLNEYRTRLIAEVVTGQLDVRDAVAKLPE